MPDPMQLFVNEGDVLAGKYRVEEVLGRGGMGVVVAATHLQLGQRVALKILRPELLLHPAASARFMREAQASARIESEHVTRVMDVGTLDNGLPFIVMELLKGADLSRILRENGRLAVDDALNYVLQACAAVREAHAHGIVHRDLKPANLFLTRRSDGSPLLKVLDFGISKTLNADENDAAMTTTNAFMGSPFYMAPEQLRNSKDVDERADIWSLGVVLYELLCGVTPYSCETPWDLIASIIESPPPSLRSRRPEVSEALELAVFRCLQRDREQRFQTLVEFSDALRACRAELPVQPIAQDAQRSEEPPRVVRAESARRAGLEAPVVASAASAVSHTSPPGLTTSAWREPGRRAARSLGVLSALAVVGAVSVGAFFAKRALRSYAAPDASDAPRAALSREVSAAQSLGAISAHAGSEPALANAASGPHQPEVTPVSTASAGVPDASASAHPARPPTGADSSRPRPRPVATANPLEKFLTKRKPSTNGR